MKPKVSVVWCGYNQKQFAGESIESVLGQSYPNVELIAIDNGSSDGSSELMARYSGDPRVKLLLHDKNEAVTKRLNEGVRLSTGEFISFLHADDYLLPRKVELQLERFAALGEDYGVVYSSAYRVNVLTGRRWLVPGLGCSGGILKDMFLKYHGGGLVDFTTPLARRECYLKHPFYEDVFFENEAVFFRLAVSHKFSYIDEPLAVTRDHLSNAGKALKRNTENFMILLDRLGREKDFPPELQSVLRAFRAEYWRRRAWQALRVAADPAWARDCLGASIRVDRRQALHPQAAAALLLSFLPAAALRGLNRAINRLRARPGNVAFKEDYQ